MEKSKLLRISIETNGSEVALDRLTIQDVSDKSLGTTRSCLMLRSGCEANDHELQLMDAGVIGVRSSQLPIAIFLRRWGTIARMKKQPTW